MLLVAAVFASIVATHLDVVPIWDATNYLQCVEQAVIKPFDLLNFRCWGHPALFYDLLWAATQYVWPWTPAPMYVVNAVIGVASIVAFDGLVRRLFPDQGSSEYALVTALYAFAPLFVSHAVFLSVDFGATALFVIYLYFLAVRRFWIAAVVAVALLFTKETGAAAWAVTLGAYITAWVLRPGQSWPQRVLALRALYPQALVVVPVVAFAWFAAVVRHVPGGLIGSYAAVQALANPFDAFLNTNLADPSMRAFLADIFILNYQWLYTAVIAAAIGAALIRVSPHVDDSDDRTRRGIFLTLVLGGLVYIVTRYRSSNGARYVLLATPLLLLVFYHALLSVCERHSRRLAYLSGCVALVFISNFRTIDFVSRSFFGTFAFGEHALLNMTSLTGGLNLDSIVYNLEFLQLQYLYADMIQDLRPQSGSVLLMGNAIYNFPPDIDGRDYRLTSEPSHVLPLFVALGDVKREVIASHMQRNGQLFYYVAFANADNVQLRGLLADYPLVRSKRYQRHGYALDLYVFSFPFA